MLIKSGKKQVMIEIQEFFCKCDICGKEYSYTYWDRGITDSWCSQACYQRYAERKKKETIKRSTQHRKFVRGEIRAALPDSICSHCQKPFRPLRNDAKFCSDKCKQADYRQRKNTTTPLSVSIPVQEQVTITPKTSDKMKIIVFSSPSCGPCRGYKEELKKLEKNKKFVETCELNILDVDENADLARGYGVQNLPTTVISDHKGNKLEIVVGSVSAKNLQQTINKLVSSSA